MVPRGTFGVIMGRRPAHSTANHTGHHGQHGSSLSPQLHGPLYKMAINAPPEPRKPVPAGDRRRLRGKPGGKPKLSDAQVLEIRARYEFEGWSMDRLAEAYGMGRR